MAKRANPYIEDFIPQSKVHIGLRQFNNNDDRLKKVYEKTLELLFKGAKKSVVQEALTSSDTTCSKKDHMKQLFIGTNGMLLHSGKLVRNINSIVKQCSCAVTVADLQCSYCDETLCDTCQHGCTRCDRVYCSRCILMGGDGFDVCVSCYT